MKISEKFKQELIEELMKKFPGYKQYLVDDFEEHLGADTVTYSFTLHLDNEMKFLIVRIFRDITDNAKREFQILKNLLLAKVSVPEVYFLKVNSQTIDKSYYVMEEIPGMLFSDFFANVQSEEEKEHLMRIFIHELAKIHDINMESLDLDCVETPSENDSYIFVNRMLSVPSKLIKEYKISELELLLEWLEENKVKCDRLTLIHGDYHMNNVIVTPEGKLVVIDWGADKLGDYRLDLGFSIVATSSTGLDVKEKFTTFYREFTNQEVTNIEYFMILSILFNLVRMYSIITNFEITSETDTTKHMFMIEYKEYSKYLLSIVKEVTGIQLPTLEKELN